MQRHYIGHYQEEGFHLGTLFPFPGSYIASSSYHV